MVDGAQTRCIVVAEGDPRAAAVGRLSFRGFNPEAERLQREADARVAAQAAAADDPEGKSISDEALAEE